VELTGSAKLLRIFIGELDKHHKKPLYEEIVALARKMKIAGATVFRGILSYGASSVIHKTKIMDLSADLPLIIEIVDVENKINEFLPLLDNLFKESKCGGLITIEKVEILKYFHGEPHE
jgi:PII-like signaling protein